MERHAKKDHGLTEKGNVIENSAGIAIFTTEALVKEKVSEARLSHKWQKDEDQKSGEEAAENDGAPEQLPFEINKWIYL